MHIIGHRGAGKNTLQSFDFAIKNNVYMVELDIRLCKTDEIIVFHDNTINYNNTIKYIEDMTLQELKEYNKDICTLDEVFDFIKGKCKIMIEIKKTKSGIVPRLHKFIEKQLNTPFWNKDDIVVQSFYEPYLIEFNYTGIKKGLTMAGIIFSTENLHFYDFVVICNSCLCPVFIEDCSQMNIKVFVYTINNILEYNKAKSLNVSGIITDKPDIFLQK